jgi:2-oxoglutarate ferredoxin oxidoreductase subunit beta
VLGGSQFIARSSVTSPKNIIKTKQLIEKGFKTQIQKKGFSLIEVLSPCPVYWRMTSVESIKFIDEEMTKAFPLGIFKDWERQN